LSPLKGEEIREKLILFLNPQEEKIKENLILTLKVENKRKVRPPIMLGNYLFLILPSPLGRYIIFSLSPRWERVRGRK